MIGAGFHAMDTNINRARKCEFDKFFCSIQLWAKVTGISVMFMIHIKYSYTTFCKPGWGLYKCESQ